MEACWVDVAVDEVDGRDCEVQGEEEDVEGEQCEEWGVIGAADAAIEPQAVVVKGDDALVAGLAVLACEVDVALQSRLVCDATCTGMQW